MPDDKKESPSIMDMIRSYVMGHGGIGATDDKEYEVAMNVEPSSGTAKGYAAGGVVEPDDMADIPMPTENIPRGTAAPATPPSAAPIQNVLAQSQGLGAQMFGQYTPQMRNQLYAAMLERQNSMPNAAGNTLAGVGDAIARGYGHSQSDFLNQTQQGARAATEQGLGAFDTAQKANLAQTQAGMDLGKMDPASAVSKIYQDSYSGPLKKLGYSDAQIAKMSASNIEPVAQVGLKYGDIEAQKELKEATLELSAKMNEAQIENMKAGRVAQQQEIKQKQEEVNKSADVEAAKHWFLHPQLAAQAQGRLAQGSSQGTPASQIPSFASEDEVHKANLPKGTIVMVGGRRARVD